MMTRFVKARAKCMSFTSGGSSRSDMTTCTTTARAALGCLGQGHTLAQHPTDLGCRLQIAYTHHQQPPWTIRNIHLTTTITKEAGTRHRRLNRVVGVATWLLCHHASSPRDGRHPNRPHQVDHNTTQPHQHEHDQRPRKTPRHSLSTTRPRHLASKSQSKSSSYSLNNNNNHDHPHPMRPAT